MLERYFITPKNSYKTAANNRVAYTPVVVVRTGDYAHVYLSGRTARLPNGQLHGKGDMRAQIRLVCENIKTALDTVGATFADVVRTTTYTTDIDEYFRCSDERFKFFKDPLPPAHCSVLPGSECPTCWSRSNWRRSWRPSACSYPRNSSFHRRCSYFWASGLEKQD